MKKRNLLALIFAGLVALTAGLPVTSAQQIPGCEAFAVSSLSLTAEQTDPIRAGNKTDLLFTWRYLTTTLSFTLEPIEVQFDVDEVPPWATVALNLSTVFVAVEPLEPTDEQGQIGATIHLDQGAPPGEEAVMLFRADSSEGTCVGPATHSAPAVIKVHEQAEAPQDDDPAPEAEPVENGIPAPGAVFFLVATASAMAGLMRIRK